MLEPEFPDVLAAARDGGNWAWRRLIDGIAGPMLGYFRSQGASEPEDLLSEVLVQLARHLDTFTGDEKAFRSWAFTVAHSRIIDDRRHQRRHPVDPVASVDPLVPAQEDVTSAEVIDTIGADGVRRLIERLVPAQRDVLLLRIVAGLTVPEVAAAVARSEGAVKALQRRGLLALSKLVDSEGIPR